MVFYTLGAPFVAALEVIIYAGAIMVLFVFVVMMLNLGEERRRARSSALAASHRMWIGPSILAAILIAEFVYLLTAGPGASTGGGNDRPSKWEHRSSDLI